MIAGMAPEWNPVSHCTGVRLNQSVWVCMYANEWGRKVTLIILLWKVVSLQPEGCLQLRCEWAQQYLRSSLWQFQEEKKKLKKSSAQIKDPLDFLQWLATHVITKLINSRLKVRSRNHDVIEDFGFVKQLKQSSFLNYSPHFSSRCQSTPVFTDRNEEKS